VTPRTPGDLVQQRRHGAHPNATWRFVAPSWVGNNNGSNDHGQGPVDSEALTLEGMRRAGDRATRGAEGWDNTSVTEDTRED